jgi:hypothetical protein
LHTDRPKSNEFGGFINAVGEALDLYGFAAAFASPPDLRDAGASLVSYLRRGLGPLLGHLHELNITPTADHDTFSTAVEQFEAIIDVCKGRLAPSTFESLKRQLPYTLGDDEELSEPMQRPDAASFGAMLTYLAKHHWIKPPSLTLTRNGIFVANWRLGREQKARLSVDFLDEKRARWSAVDSRDVETPTMVGGVCPMSRLEAHLRIYKNWLRR